MYIGEDIKIGVYHVVAFVNTHMYLLYHHMHNRPDTKSVIIDYQYLGHVRGHGHT